MHAHHCSRARPTPERSSAFASSPVLNCDTCKIFFRAILPNFSCGVIWHTDRGEEKEEGEGGKVVSWELTRCCACHVCCKIRRTGRQTRDAAHSRGDLALALPSADLRHHTVIVTAARPPLCLCVCARVGGLAAPAANGPIGRRLSTVIFAMPRWWCRAPDASHLRNYRGELWTPVCACVCVDLVCACATRVCVRVRARYMKVWVCGPFSLPSWPQRCRGALDIEAGQ